MLARVQVLELAAVQYARARELQVPVFWRLLYILIYILICILIYLTILIYMRMLQ